MQDTRVDYVLHGGMVVSASAVQEASVAIKGELITAVGHPRTMPLAGHYLTTKGQVSTINV